MKKSEWEFRKALIKWRGVSSGKKGPIFIRRKRNKENAKGKYKRNGKKKFF